MPESLDPLLRDLRDSYFDALIDGDDAAAEEVIRGAIDLRLSENEVAQEVIAPALRRVGDLWERGVISVADEHLATRITLRVLALQREAYRVSRDRVGRCVALAGVEGEEHVIGLEMAANLLTHSGYDVRYFGPDVPVGALESVVAKHSPDVFCFTIAMSARSAALGESIQVVRRLAPEVSVLVGGRAVPARLRPTPWLAISREVVDVVEMIDALVRRPALN